MNMLQPRESLCETLAAAARILADHHLLDFNQGQVSARRPGTETFLINSAERGLDELQAGDFVNIVAGHDGGKSPPETPLHEAIYAARSDVGGIVHVHGPYGILIGATDYDLRPISHDGAAFIGQLGRYDASSCTILTRKAGDGVASALADGRAVLMRNHGALTVGRSIQEAVVLMLMLERACWLEWQALCAPFPVHVSCKADVQEKRRFNFSMAALRSFWSHARRASASRTSVVQLGASQS